MVTMPPLACGPLSSWYLHSFPSRAPPHRSHLSRRVEPASTITAPWQPWRSASPTRSPPPSPTRCSSPRSPVRWRGAPDRHFGTKNLSCLRPDADDRNALLATTKGARALHPISSSTRDAPTTTFMCRRSISPLCAAVRRNGTPPARPLDNLLAHPRENHPCQFPPGSTLFDLCSEFC